MYFLIAGYNTLSKEEKEKFDIKGIANVFRNTMFGMAGCIILGYFMDKKFENQDLDFIMFIVALIIGIPYLLITTNSKKYKL
jgi:MFS-type transporter involved in bile tolerance (Atg22 family)